ncbi:hypothetical protein DOTSEDRAFT_86814 [Dothistroma septosporum NZE10]|uniref:Phosphoglycerate mutase-like protein n=1 Tax=Dothistroma septosporum (strain NZE10 / CBS 128990) TaxID=675120 RepID=N1PS51_DOTSN|nr:hypothetical protein DOTSEDRAFT_86814 [Dothistroma septosporum NZE10]
MGSTPPRKPLFRYEAVHGLFLQDDPKTDWNTFEYMKHNFGLVSQPYPSDTRSTAKDLDWLRFSRYISHLQTTAPHGTFYKLFYLGRHGEGFHNVAEAKYGTTAWDDYWSKLEGDGSLFWSDAHLTELGESQAMEAHSFIGEQLAWAKMLAPETYVVSPMFRCLQTASITFQKLALPNGKEFRPIIKELAREVLGVHTCDRRSTKSYIRGEFPRWEFEGGFEEEDELWLPDHRETHDEHDARTTELLDEIFETNEGKTVMSLTIHSGAIASHLRVYGHREFGLPTGGMIPVLVKATRL